MIMQNSYLRMANSTRTSQLNIVQGDKSPIAFQLLDRRQQPITSINGQIAEISIFESKGMTLREFSEARVEDGVFTFHLEQVLNTGAHEMRVKVGDYYFPSDTGTFTFNILPAHDITTEVDPTDIKTIDLVIDALADEIVDYFYPVLEETTHEYFVQNAPVFKGEDFKYEDFTPEQLTELSMKVATESKDEDGNTIVTFSDGTVVTVSKGDKGDKGDQGIQGIQGEIGRTGDKGDRGLTGLTGAKGEKGDALTYEELSPQQKLELKGEKGEKGDKGDKGDTLKFADLTPEQIEELQQEVDYSQVAQKEHTHELSEVNGLSTELDAKANSTDHEALEQRVDDIADEEGNINAGTIPMAHDAGSASEATVRDSIYKLEDDLNTHAHTAEEIEGLSEKIADLSNAAPAVHTHAIEDVSGLRVELDSKASTTDVDDIATELDSKAEVNHTHTDKADTVHTHTTADIDGLDTKLSDLENNSGGIPAEHTHDLADVTGLQDELNDKADKNHNHTTADIAGLDTKLSELENNSGGGIPEDHTHEISEVNGLQTELDGKANAKHSHAGDYSVKGHAHTITHNDPEHHGILVHYDKDGDGVKERKALLPYLDTEILPLKADVEHTHNSDDITVKEESGVIMNGEPQWKYTPLRKYIDDSKSGSHTHTGDQVEVKYNDYIMPHLPEMGKKDYILPLNEFVQQVSDGDFELSVGEHTHTISNVSGLQSELDNLKSSGVDAKTAISSAINSKGGSTTNTDTFDVMAQAIGGLIIGEEDEGGTGNIAFKWVMNNDSRYKNEIRLTGLDFAPDGFIFIGSHGTSNGTTNFLDMVVNNRFHYFMFGDNLSGKYGRYDNLSTGWYSRQFSKPVFTSDGVTLLGGGGNSGQIQKMSGLFIFFTKEHFSILEEYVGTEYYNGYFSSSSNYNTITFR